MVISLTTPARRVISFTALMLLITTAADSIVAQEVENKEDKPAASTPSDPDAATKVAENEKAADQDAAEKKAEEKDPFAVPEDASAKELFDFISTVKRNRGNTLQSVQKSARAAVAAAEAIRNLEDVDLEDEIKAIREQLSALAFLSRYDRQFESQLDTLVKSMTDDPRPEISRIAAVEAFKIRIASAQKASADEQLQTITKLKAMIEENGFNREMYGLASSLARAIGYSENSEIAADLYDDLAAMMAESDDESITSRAGKMAGAARRMRLPGNFMEVMGNTADGEVFQWDAYRGKVVLVDFWASWCGPCRAEVPNMKRNLERYGEKGFEIVGVNLDRTLDACEAYVEKEELTWPNLISDKEDERGWDNPLATYYGVSAIPTAILVDKEGKVVSLRARGRELDRLLSEMLGPPVEKPAEDAADEDAADEDTKDQAEPAGKAEKAGDRDA